MFTGIVESVATVESVEDDGVRTLRVVGAGIEGLDTGDSVAVAGVCLTVVAAGMSHAEFEIVTETMDRTTLGRLAPGDRVNLERPMAASGRFDGHIVQGHVDGVGVIRSLGGEPGSSMIWVDVPAGLLRFMVEKGSVAIDGVSLTVAEMDEVGILVALIPHTLAVTTLGSLHAGNPVNIEVDVLAKYVERLMEAR